MNDTTETYSMSEGLLNWLELLSHLKELSSGDEK